LNAIFGFSAQVELAIGLLVVYMLSCVVWDTAKLPLSPVTTVHLRRHTKTRGLFNGPGTVQASPTSLLCIEASLPESANSVCARFTQT